MMIKNYVQQPYFRMLIIGAIVLLLLNSCEYGLEHGNVAENPTTTTNQNPAAAQDQGTTGGASNAPGEAPTANVTEKEFTEKDLTYQGKKAIVTRHARCRMGCREIDAFEIQEVIDQDLINHRKNKPAEAGRCASIAYEGTTRDRQHVRVIVGDCERDPIIITVIDLGNKYNCTCD
ncbi:MAG: Unknown protein [uncultured Aureispira sp.]|jgi:hypothetical protein|uniref:DUF4258 domain-containing protein n=1 Tax=uncultured Aureispira sp. TaxID=1331704 RepID=A0A6S6UAJ4_9BACT|nr:MAG: Unknown protein [uncultured Aureispira sp.]